MYILKKLLVVFLNGDNLLYFQIFFKKYIFALENFSVKALTKKKKCYSFLLPTRKKKSKIRVNNI